eukprot:7037976-Heterocapsa_arctica.AAC.1
MMMGGIAVRDDVIDATASCQQRHVHGLRECGMVRSIAQEGQRRKNLNEFYGHNLFNVIPTSTSTASTTTWPMDAKELVDRGSRRSWSRRRTVLILYRGQREPRGIYGRDACYAVRSHAYHEIKVTIDIIAKGLNV